MKHRRDAGFSPLSQRGAGGDFTEAGTGNRCQIPPNPPFAKGGVNGLDVQRRTLLRRREFLIASAGGLAALFAATDSLAVSADPWPVLAAVQEHLFPSEPGAPGAREIRALAYLQGVLADPGGEPETQRFVLMGVDWLEDLARERYQATFVDLDALRRERLLRQVAASEKGENWLSTLLLYVCEALLVDPVYGGNPEGIGWAWLEHQTGFPRPTPDKRYGALKP